MKVSGNWLNQYVAIRQSPEELAEMLTMGGLEVEDVEHIGFDPDGVVVGRVLEVRPHPNADRLTLCTVDLGNGEPVQIVCGAPNVAAGQNAPVATVGTTLMLPDRDDPDQRLAVEIKKAKLRGEVSEGMICAEDELGLSDNHEGIMVLPDSAEVGLPFADYLRSQGLEPTDAVLDVSITPNRPDAASHIGVARDVAALSGSPLKRPPVDLPEEEGETADHIRIDVMAEAACPRYVAMVVRGITVAESPAWLKNRLSSIGLRPRNNIVDITNFVLHEIGQPLHAFDLDKIAGPLIRVRLTEGETAFRTLDSKKRVLPPGTMMIADAERDVAIAGVMGGENSEVTENTTNVLIESAFFDQKSIRKTAKALGLQTDASYRFERGVDREGQIWAAARAAQLMVELAGGVIVPGVVDVRAQAEEDRVVAVRSSRIDALLGIHVPFEEARSLLEAIGFGVVVGGADAAPVLSCTVPTYRPDVEREVDVIEEIIRLYGYDRIPEPERSVRLNRTLREPAEDRLRRAGRSFLSGIGFREIYTNSMLRRDLADTFNHTFLFGEDATGRQAPAAGDPSKAINGDGRNQASSANGTVETLNPISQEMAAMRPSLVPGALQVVSFNRKHGRRMFRFFEFGHVYRKSRRDDAIVHGYAEHESLIIVASGPAAPVGWDVEERPVDLFDLKGAVATLLESIRLPDVSLEPDYRATAITSHHLTIYTGETRIGVLGRLADAVARDFDLVDAVYFAEINWQSVVNTAVSHGDRQYVAVSRYPIVERDLAVIIDRAEPAGHLMRTIREEAGPLLHSVEPFDLYEGERIGEGKKSIAFSLRFGADRTLLDEEVDERVDAVVGALAKKHGGELRG